MSEDNDSESPSDACELESRIIDVLEDLQPDPFVVIMVLNRIVCDVIMSMGIGEDDEPEVHAVQ
jgi:hypothetical protein